MMVPKSWVIESGVRVENPDARFQRRVYQQGQGMSMDAGASTRMVLTDVETVAATVDGSLAPGSVAGAYEYVLAAGNSGSSGGGGSSAREGGRGSPAPGVEGGTSGPTHEELARLKAELSQWKQTAKALYDGASRALLAGSGVAADGTKLDEEGEEEVEEEEVVEEEEEEVDEDSEDDEEAASP
jgi:hypothetical protein